MNNVHDTFQRIFATNPATPPKLTRSEINDDDTQQKYRQYIALLEVADWSFEFSDDGDVRNRGATVMKKLRQLQKEIDPFHRIWNAFAPASCQNGRSYA